MNGRSRAIHDIVRSLDPHRDCDWFCDLPSLRAINRRMDDTRPVRRSEVTAVAPGHTKNNRRAL